VAHLGMTIEASLQDRWTIAGITGCGKTTLAKQLIQELKRSYPAAHVYILDSKGAGDFDDVPGFRIYDEVAPDALKTPGATLIWTPPYDNLLSYHQWFEKLLQARDPAIVLIDELSSLTGEKQNAYPVGYAKLMKQGRGLDISVVSLTQEAAYIPRQTFGQTTHLISFRLEDEHDRRKLARKFNIAADRSPRHPYGFFYRRLDRPVGTYEYRDWREFLGRS
jgi:energy-coupling factor transporter ATP-binding protein EcfA2